MIFNTREGSALCEGVGTGCFGIIGEKGGSDARPENCLAA